MKQFEEAECCEDCYFFHFAEDYGYYKIGYCALWSNPKRPLYTDAYSRCDDCMKEKKRGSTLRLLPPLSIVQTVKEV